MDYNNGILLACCIAFAAWGIYLMYKHSKSEAIGKGDWIALGVIGFFVCLFAANMEMGFFPKLLSASPKKA